MSFSLSAVVLGFDSNCCNGVTSNKSHSSSPHSHKPCPPGSGSTLPASDISLNGSRSQQPISRYSSIKTHSGARKSFYKCCIKSAVLSNGILHHGCCWGFHKSSFSTSSELLDVLTVSLPFSSRPPSVAMWTWRLTTSPTEWQNLPPTVSSTAAPNTPPSPTTVMRTWVGGGF